MSKRIYKSSKDKVLAGVCGGVAEYFNVDPVIVRLIWVLATVIYGVGFILYIIAAIIMPQDSSEETIRYQEGEYDSEKGKKVLGISLIVFGILFMAKRFFFWIDSEVLIAAAFIFFGVFLFLKNGRNKNEE